MKIEKFLKENKADIDKFLLKRNLTSENKEELIEGFLDYYNIDRCEDEVIEYLSSKIDEYKIKPAKNNLKLNF